MNYADIKYRQDSKCKFMFSLATTEWHALEAVKLFLQLALQIDVFFCFVLIMLSTWNCWIDHVHTCTKGIHGRVSINSLINTWSIVSLDSINTWLLVWQSVESPLTYIITAMHQLKVSWLSADYWVMCQWSVDQVSTEVLTECQ